MNEGSKPEGENEKLQETLPPNQNPFENFTIHRTNPEILGTNPNPFREIFPTHRTNMAIPSLPNLFDKYRMPMKERTAAETANEYSILMNLEKEQELEILKKNLFDDKLKLVHRLEDATLKTVIEMTQGRISQLENEISQKNQIVTQKNQNQKIWLIK